LFPRALIHRIRGAEKHPFPKAWQPFLVNDNDPLVLPLIDAMPLHQIEKFQPIFKQMLKR
jgi:hypothetical protein